MVAAVRKYESWREIDQALRAIARKRGALDREEAALLARAEREQVWRYFGKASLSDYLEDVLGYGPRAARERVRIATALESLPAIGKALESGDQCYSAVRELTRIATADTEDEWLAATDDKNLRQIEELVAMHRPGDRPSDPPDPSLAQRIVTFKVRPATLTLLRQVQQQLATEHGGQLDDDALVEAMCNAVLGGTPATDHGRAKFQVRVTLCPRCDSGSQHGGGQTEPLDQADVERAKCDAQRVDPDRRAAQDVTPKTREFVFHRDRGRCVVPGCRAARFLDVHHIVYRADGGDHSAENLAVMCSHHHRALHHGRLTMTGPASKLVVGTAPTPVGHAVQRHATFDQTTVKAGAKRALIKLGHPRSAASPMVECAATPGLSLEETIRGALREGLPATAARSNSTRRA